MKGPFCYILSLGVLISCMMAIHHIAYVTGKSNGNVLSEIVHNELTEEISFQSASTNNADSKQFFIVKENEDVSTDLDYSIFLTLHAFLYFFSYCFFLTAQRLYTNTSLLKAKAFENSRPRYILFHMLRIPYLLF